MMKKILITLLLLISGLPVWGITISDDYLRGISGARAIGMGGAFGALANTPDGACWNPAGIALINENIGFTGHWSNYFEETSVYGISCSIPAPVGVAGINYIQERTSDIPQTSENENGRPEIKGYFYNAKTAINFTYAFSFFDDIYFGTNLKFYNHLLSTYYARSYGLDIGLLYNGENSRQPFLPFNLGFTIYNLLAPKLTWPSGNVDEFSRQFSVSLAYPFNFNQSKINLVSEATGYSGGVVFSFGAEYWPVEILAIRMGLNPRGLSFGLGLKIRDKFSFDVAYTGHSDLGANYQLSISYFTFPI